MFTTKQNKSVLNSNINFMQLKLHDFSDEKNWSRKKSFSKRLNKTPDFENTNHKTIFRWK